MSTASRGQRTDLLVASGGYSTHVWDAHWSELGRLANALFEDRNPPQPSPDTNWRLLGAEEKASIVHTSHRVDHENLLNQRALNDDYFHYIRQPRLARR